MKTIQRTGLAALALALAVGCTNSLTGDGGSDDDDDDGKPPGSEEDELQGAGGRDLTEFWPEIDIPYSENVKMLDFDMMRNEVQRATGLSWVVDGVNQWALYRTALGGADYVTVWSEDRNASQQKMVVLRKMAFQVCGDLVDREAGAGTRTVFDVVDPGATIDTDNPDVTVQIERVYERFFHVEPSAAEVTLSLTLLEDLQGISDAGEAWRGLCGSYLASMRFLTY